jgi:hypothetical protein
LRKGEDCPSPDLCKKPSGRSIQLSHEATLELA